MAGQLIGPIDLKLTDAQLAVASDALEYSASVGDCCPAVGHCVRFPDYEGAIAFQNRVFGLATPTTREFISMQAIASKLDVAIIVAANRAAKKAGTR